MEAIEVLATEFDIGGDADERLRRKLESARDRVEELEQQEPAVTALDEYDEFAEDEYVRQAIEEAKETANRTRYVKGVVASIVQRGSPATRKDVLDDLGLAEGTGHHIHDAMQALADTGVVTVDGRGMEETADFDFDGLQELHERQARRERTEGVMEEL